MGKPTDKTDPDDLITMSFRVTLRHRNIIDGAAKRQDLHASALMRRLVFDAVGIPALEALAYEKDAEAQVSEVAAAMSPVKKRLAALQRITRGRDIPTSLPLPMAPAHAPTKRVRKR